MHVWISIKKSRVIRLSVSKHQIKMITQMFKDLLTYPDAQLHYIHNISAVAADEYQQQQQWHSNSGSNTAKITLVLLWFVWHSE